MRVHPIAACALLVFLVAPAWAQQAPTGAPPAPAANPAYPDSAKGLTRLFEDILRATKRGDSQALDLFVRSLVLPKDSAWFKKTFGDETGKNVAAGYAAIQGELPSMLAQEFSVLVAEKLSAAHAHRFQDACDSEADETQYPVLAARAIPEPLYAVRVMNASGDRGRLLGLFAYVDNSFRYLGSVDFKFHSISPVPPGGGRIEVEGEGQQVRLINRVAPHYPEEERRNHMQGTVKVFAVIDREGRVTEMHVVKGRCLLAQAAMKAFREWRYSPTLLNGQPVEVETTLMAIFTLAPR
jgi:TonB family protein